MPIKPKLLTVFGTRPEAIKMCPLVLALKECPFFESKLCVSGQHREMLDSVLSEFSVAPDFDLDIMRDCHSPSEINARILDRLTPVLEYNAPDAILVHGDTSTAFAAALAAFYLKIPVFHVEAGLRSKDMYSPFPEEFNRAAIDMISELFFAPTEHAARNLLSEGKGREFITVTGNTVIDSLLLSIKKDFRHPLLPDLLPQKDSIFALLTLHRRENIGSPMREVLSAVRQAVKENPKLSLLFPIHKNPAVRSIAEEELSGCERIFITEPLSNTVFRNMMARCDLILTDSGGIQEEAAFLGKPLFILRDTTERPEVSDSARLVGTDREKVYNSLSTVLKNPRILERMSRPSTVFGTGDASKKIISTMYNYFFG